MKYEDYVYSDGTFDNFAVWVRHNDGGGGKRGKTGKNGFCQTDRAVLNKDITIFARLPNVADGTKVKITISEVTTKKETPLVYELESVVKHGKVKALWRVKYDVDDETDLGFDENYEQPSYVFCVSYEDKTSEVSKPVRLFCDLYMKLDFHGRVLTDYPYCLRLSDGST